MLHCTALHCTASYWTGLQTDLPLSGSRPWSPSRPGSGPFGRRMGAARTTTFPPFPFPFPFPGAARSRQRSTTQEIRLELCLRHVGAELLLCEDCPHFGISRKELANGFVVARGTGVCGRGAGGAGARVWGRGCGMGWGSRVCSRGRGRGRGGEGRVHPPRAPGNFTSSTHLLSTNHHHVPSTVRNGVWKAEAGQFAVLCGRV